MTDESWHTRRGTSFSFRSPLEDFEREELVGEGGMSTVWRARHRGTGQRVALKLLRAEGITDPTWAQRFQREARAMSELRHPNIGRVLAFGEGADGLFIAFELIEGGTVRELKAAMGGTVPVPIAVEILAQLLVALEYAHAAGVIHRDIKPGNVMLTREGVVKLVDFGIAKGEDDLHITRTGAVLGTPAFMSPEQAEGDRTDERSDLFSAGIVLSDLVTGRSPFSADSTAATLMRVLREEVPLLCEGAGGVPWSLERLHGRLVDRERERRPLGADFALDELKPLLHEIRARWPRLLADAVAHPEETSRTVRAESAMAEVRRADAILKRHGPHPSAVLALIEANRVDPTLEEPARRLPQLAADAGVVLRRGPDDDALAEVIQGLRFQPRQALLWRRLADLRRLRGESFDEMIALKRVLRLRKDEDVERRLAHLTLGPEANHVEKVERGEKTTSSIAHERALERQSQLPAWRRLARPLALAASVLLLGILSGAAVALLWTRPETAAGASTPSAPPARAAAQTLRLDGLTARVGPGGASTLLTSEGEIALGGALEAVLDEGFIPAPSDAFVVVRARSLSGGFEDGAVAAASPRGSFFVEVTPTEVRLVRYNPYGRVTRRDAPRVPVRGPALVNLWGAPCVPELQAWRRVAPLLPEDMNVVHVTRRRGDPARTDLGAAEDDLRTTVQLDPEGARFFLPTGVIGCSTLLVDAEGRPRLRTTATTPGYASELRRAWESLATEPPILDDTTPTVGERIQRLRNCAPDSRCAQRAVDAWANGAPLDATDVDACLLGCDPGAAPVSAVVAAARRAMRDDDPDRALRLLEPWRASDVPEVQRGLGDAYLKARRLDEARAHYRRYLELAPNAPDAEQVRREIGP